jgi:hypothetical protein
MASKWRGAWEKDRESPRIHASNRRGGSHLGRGLASDAPESDFRNSAISHG